MPDITIVKLKIRRGSDVQRKSIVLDQGELGYTIDTQRVFVGNGVKKGGNVVGNIIHPPTKIKGRRITQSNAVIGDVIFDNSLLWQLTGNDYSSDKSWANISMEGDNKFIRYDVNNNLTIVDKSITPSKISNSLVFPTGGLTFSTAGLSANVDGTYLSITSSNKLTVNTIDQHKIRSTALGKGIQGGSGSVLSLNVDDDYFGFYTNTLTITALPRNIVTANNINSTSLGAGLEKLGSQIVTSVRDYDTRSFNVDDYTLRLAPIARPGSTVFFDNINYNSYGQITGSTSAIVTTFSGRSTGTSSVFNGAWNQTKFTNQTLVTVMSSNSTRTRTEVKVLTSAGFMAINTRYGDRFAIPVFRY
jgi:hypothetical protein